LGKYLSNTFFKIYLLSLFLYLNSKGIVAEYSIILLSKRGSLPSIEFEPIADNCFKYLEAVCLEIFDLIKKTGA
jgi:hypothetical protein